MNLDGTLKLGLRCVPGGIEQEASSCNFKGLVMSVIL